MLRRIFKLPEIPLSYFIAFPLFDRNGMRYFIGITQEPASAKVYVKERYGEEGCFTEIGPFPSRVDALNWLVYLKSRIADCEEILPESLAGRDAVWFGFTYEAGS